MTPSNAMLNRLQTILSTDTGSLNAATALKLHLAQAAFTPSPTLTLASLTEATFQGYAAVSAGIGAAQASTNPLTGNRRVQLLEPAGGWHFGASGTTGLPQTVYGWYLTDNAVATLWGSQLFPAPIALALATDAADVSQVYFEMPAGALI